MDNFKLKIIAPAGVAAETEVVSVTVPEGASFGSGGEITFLPGHVQFYGILGVGVLNYTESSDPTPKRVVISGGIAEFANGILSVLADSVDFADQIDRAHYQEKRVEVQKVVDSLDSASPEWAQAHKQLLRIEAIDRLIDQ